MRTSATHLDPRPRHRPRLAVVAVFMALSLVQAQALAQGPPGGRPPSLQPPPTQPQPPNTTPDPDAALPEPTPTPAPTPEPTPEPTPTPEPQVGPAPAPTPGLTARERDRADKLRLAGLGTMAGGGVLSAFSFGLTLAFTIQGRNRHEELANVEDERQRQDCSRMTSTSCTELTRRIDNLDDQRVNANRNAQISGAMMLTGFVAVAVGGLLYRIGVRRLEPPPPLARIKLSPSLGGIVLSGRF